MSPRRFAEQLSVFELGLFRAIEPGEFHRGAWTKEKRASTAPNICRMIQHSNAMSAWVATVLLVQRTPKERVDALAYMVEVAHECAALACFSAVQEIVLGLENRHVKQLQQMWSGLPHQYRRMLLDCRTLVSVENNMQAYRRELRTKLDAVARKQATQLPFTEAASGSAFAPSAGMDTTAGSASTASTTSISTSSSISSSASSSISSSGVGEPAGTSTGTSAGSTLLARITTASSSSERAVTGVVPCLGTHLTDVLYADTGNVDRDAHSGLVNFRKMRVVGAMLDDLRVLQHTAYDDVRPDPVAQRWLRGMGTHVISDDAVLGKLFLVAAAMDQEDRPPPQQQQPQASPPP